MVPADRALGRAIGDDRDVAQPELQSGLRMGDMKHERRPAQNRRVDESRRNPEIFGKVETGGAALRGGADQPVDIAERQPTIVERAVNALRHQVDRAHLGGDRTQIGFGDADDRGAAALQAAHHAPSTGTKTG